MIEVFSFDYLESSNLAFPLQQSKQGETEPLNAKVVLKYIYHSQPKKYGGPLQNVVSMEKEDTLHDGIFPL